MSHSKELQLSIVVAVPEGGPVLSACLEALVAQTSGIAAEILVVDGTEAGSASRWVPPSGCVRFLQLGAGTEVPCLWQAGITASTGKIIALLVDSCVPGPDWVQQVLLAHQADCAVIGGAIDLAPVLGTVDSAIYFCRYSQYMPPFAATFLDDLPGINCAYKRAALAGLQDELANGFWETFVHRRIRARGERLLCLPEILVHYAGATSGLSFLRMRFHHGRSFALRCAKVLKLQQKILRVLAFPLVPFLMLARIAWRVWGRRRRRKTLLACTPLLLIFLTAWSAGECVGYLLSLFRPSFGAKKSEGPVLREAG